MNFKQITSIYFSPTESTKKVVELIADQITGNKGSLDLTDSRMKGPDYTYTENEAVLIGVPVYGGRIPAAAAARMKKLHGRKTPAVLVVTYGNRAYEDALLELKTLLINQGFHPIAAAAVVTEHNIFRAVAAGRPDQKDQEAIRRFGQQVENFLRTMKSTYDVPEVTVPGNSPYREYNPQPLKIKVSSSCNKCGLCIKKCPVQAISRTDPGVTDRGRCISCMRCIRLCPLQCRKLSPMLLFVGGRKMKKMCARRNEPEFYNLME